MFESKEGIIKPIVYVGIINETKLLLVDYKLAPNPVKSGWWIPAPGLKFGADPKESALGIATELGIKTDSIRLNGVESFVLPGGWHLIYHYIIKTQTQSIQHQNINRSKWVTASELKELKDIAHGKWEINTGINYLES